MWTGRVGKWVHGSRLSSQHPGTRSGHRRPCVRRGGFLTRALLTPEGRVRWAWGRPVRCRAFPPPGLQPLEALVPPAAPGRGI